MYTGIICAMPLGREMAMPFFDFHSHKVYYTDSGLPDVPVLLFIHGWTQSSKCFKKQFDHFRPKYRVIAFDFLGHGESDRPEPVIEGLVHAGYEYSPRGYQDSLVALMEHLEIERATLLGWSLGVQVAIEVARQYPEKVD